MKLTGKTIPEGLKKRVELSGNEIAYIFDDVSYTWKECDRISDRIADRLYERGVRKGTHVGILGVNTISWIMHYYAIEKLGAVGVLLNYNYKKDEIKSLLLYTDVEYLAVGESKGSIDYPKIMEQIEEELPRLKEWFLMQEFLDDCLEDTLPDRAKTAGVEGKSHPSRSWDISRVKDTDTALIIFTSGTTNRPKGVMLGHGQLMDAMNEVADRMHWSSSDRLLMPLPLFHGSGANCGLLVSLLAGMQMVLMRYYHSVPVMQLIEKYKCTTFNAVPSMLYLMIQNEHFGEYDISSLKNGTMSGATISPDGYRKVCETLGLEKMQPAYGMTELSTLSTLADYDDPVSEKAGSCGKPFPGVEMRIWNCGKEQEADQGIVGEIQVKGKYIMQGYYNMEEESRTQFTEDGWFRTGDAGCLDEYGNLHFKTRISEMIVRGGENISPPEIEDCIEHYDDSIENVKVVGVEVPVIQEEVAAFIQNRSKKIDVEDLKRYVKEKLADFKVPKYVFQIDTFPMTGSGKTDGKALKKLARELADKQEGKK